MLSPRIAAHITAHITARITDVDSTDCLTIPGRG